jgi:hypothetical protein
MSPSTQEESRYEEVHNVLVPDVGVESNTNTPRTFIHGDAKTTPDVFLSTLDKPLRGFALA